MIETVLSVLGTILTYALIYINMVMNLLGRVVVTPLVSILPGWLSNTIIGGVVGVVALLVFKYMSNQDAIAKVRNKIKAQMLALKLFKDDISVTFKSLGGVFGGSFKLLFYAIKPMLVMIVPISLILSQVALWYQARPLLPGEEATVTVQLNGDVEASWPELAIEGNDSFEVTMGPVKAFSNREIFWKVKALEEGTGKIAVKVDDSVVEKEFVVGDGFARVSLLRPGQEWIKVLLHPWEKPFGSDSVVHSIGIKYPDRASFLSGTSSWVIYLFVASMVIGLIFMPVFKVKM